MLCCIQYIFFRCSRGECLKTISLGYLETEPKATGESFANIHKTPCAYTCGCKRRLYIRISLLCKRDVPFLTNTGSLFQGFIKGMLFQGLLWIIVTLM